MVSAKCFCLQLQKKEEHEKQDNISGIFKSKPRIPGMVQTIRELEQETSNRRGEKERGNSERLLTYSHYVF